MVERVKHPGQILKQELDALGISPTTLAHEIRVPPNRIGQIIAGKPSITGDTALRLGHWFKVSPKFWMNLQSQYDLVLTEQCLGEVIRHLPIVSKRIYRSHNRQITHDGWHPNGQGKSWESVPVTDTDK